MKKKTKTKSAPTPLEKAYFDFLGKKAEPHWEHACRMLHNIGKPLDSASAEYKRINSAYKKLPKKLTLPTVAKFCFEAQETADMLVEDLEYALRLAHAFRDSVGYPAFAANLIGFCDNLAKTDK